MAMDPNIQNVILGLVANGLTSLLSGTYQLGKKLVRKQHPSASPQLQRILQKALEDVSEAIEWTGPPSLEEVCIFLNPPETEMVVRQLFAIQLTNEKDADVEPVRTEFRALFAHYFGLEKGKSAKSSDSIFKLLEKASEKAMDAAIEAGL